MKHKKGNGIKLIVIGIILVCLVLGYYFYLSNKKEETSEESAALITPVQEILLTNLDRNYPPTPKEVVKQFGEITKCFYNETYSEEEFLQLAAQIQKLYDAELIANNPKEQYITNLRRDIDNLRLQEIVISSYATSASTDVFYFSEDGYDWARLYCSFTLRKGTSLGSTNEVFLLRKDGDGHWKIYGWAIAEEEDTSEA